MGTSYLYLFLDVKVTRGNFLLLVLYQTCGSSTQPNIFRIGAYTLLKRFDQKRPAILLLPADYMHVIAFLLAVDVVCPVHRTSSNKTQLKKEREASKLFIFKTALKKFMIPWFILFLLRIFSLLELFMVGQDVRRKNELAFLVMCTILDQESYHGRYCLATIFSPPFTPSTEGLTFFSHRLSWKNHAHVISKLTAPKCCRDGVEFLPILCCEMMCPVLSQLCSPTPPLQVCVQ